jgi:prophage maintenance system killer protein
MKKEKVKNIAIYQAPNGAIEFRGDYEKETIWGTQKQIAEVFGVDRSVVTKHIRNIFKDKELDKKVVSAKFAQTTQHGAIKGKTQTKTVEFYNLDIILAVGYRANSSKAIEFRKWATKTLKQHLLYFMVKNHPFVDGNKRSGAFAFVWFLRKTGLLRASLTPEALTALTLLLAESAPKDKDKMIGLVLLLLNGKYE